MATSALFCSSMFFFLDLLSSAAAFDTWTYIHIYLWTYTYFYVYINQHFLMCPLKDSKVAKDVPRSWAATFHDTS